MASQSNRDKKPASQMTRQVAADAEGIAEAAAVLARGGLVAFPTETVYGLGADATSDLAVARLYEAKQRPAFNPLIAHVPTLQAARRHGDFSRDALALAERLWPGPLTLVVPARPDTPIGRLARAGLDSVALRVPAHPLAQALLEAVGRPIAAPSANRSGRVSPTAVAHVLLDLDGRIDLIVDGGATPIGIESTIIACLDDGAKLLRPGGVTRQSIEAVLGRSLAVEPETGAAEIVAPGMLASHYAPRARLRLAAQAIRPGEGGLDFAGQLGPCGKPAAYLDLSPVGDLIEATANLFAFLRRLDAEQCGVIAVAPIPVDGLGEGINDRLARAAAPRT